MCIFFLWFNCFVICRLVCKICLVLTNKKLRNLYVLSTKPRPLMHSRVTPSAFPLTFFCFSVWDVISGSLMCRREEAATGLHDSSNPRSGFISILRAEIKTPSPALRYHLLRFEEQSPDTFLRPVLCSFSIFSPVIACGCYPDSYSLSLVPSSARARINNNNNKCPRARTGTGRVPDSDATFRGVQEMRNTGPRGSMSEQNHIKPIL